MVTNVYVFWGGLSVDIWIKDWSKTRKGAWRFWREGGWSLQGAQISGEDAYF
jgi:hypothetical protein